MTSSAIAQVGAAVAEVIAQAFRLADKNLTRERRVVVFTWDPVYSRLTVTYSNRKRANDGPDVLKLFCTGWDRESSKLTGRAWRTKTNARGREMWELIAGCLDLADDLIAVVSKRVGCKVAFGFTDDPEGSWVGMMR